MGKITILHCLDHMSRGGAETFIMNILRNIDLKKFNIWFMLSSDEGDYIKEIKEKGCKIFVVGTRRAGLLSYYRNIDNIFKLYANKIDIVHYHTSSLTSIELLWLAKFHRIKKRIIHSHNTNQEGLLHKILHYFNKPFLRFAATDYLACSKVAAEWMYNFTGVKNKSIIINNGIDLDLFRFNPLVRDTKRKELALSEDELVLIHVGRFCDVKNHVFLIDIFNNLLTKVPNAKLYLIGRGETRPLIEEKVKACGIDDRVIFAGIQSNVSEWLQAADVFVFPSLYEGLPVALVEAQATGIPVLSSTKVSSESKLTVNYKFLSLNDSVDKWSDRIIELYHLPRTDTSKYIIDAGYDIKTTVKTLVKSIYKI